MEEELKKLGLRVYYSEAEDREPIDFSISDEEDNVCWVWGSNPWSDVQVECNHPEECIEWGDEDERGECLLCGATCDWHYEEDNGNVEDYYWHGKERVPHEWHEPKKPKGIVGSYIKRLQGAF